MRFTIYLTSAEINGVDFPPVINIYDVIHVFKDNLVVC